MSGFDKDAAYEQAFTDLKALLEGENDQIALMASISSVLKGAFPSYYWVGFYIYKNGKLKVGPYQGTPGCLDIELGRGVCGVAAQTRETQVVADVHAPGVNHIACDPNSKSEIVVPVIGPDDELIAVLDVDSDRLDAFDEVDQRRLEEMMRCFFG